MKRGFTLVEVLSVIVIIGILSALAYSGLSDLIQVNKAKEAARTMTTFAERAITEGKMRKDEVTITLNTNKIEATFGNLDNSSYTPSEILLNGFSKNNDNKPDDCTAPNDPVTAKVSIGTSGISGSKCFVACNASGFCGAAVKKAEKNNFSAKIKRRSSTNWEDL